MPDPKAKKTPFELYQVHAKEWQNCKRCECHKHRKTVVLARGTIPCDILFIGEAPGESEDVIGEPFIGRAGKFLDSIVASVIPVTLTTAFTNIVGCIPRADEGGKADEPTDESVLACQPRLKEFIEIARPRMIVAVGKHAEHWVNPQLRQSVKFDPNIPVVYIKHPAYLLRLNPAQRTHETRICEIILRKAVGSYLEV